MADSAGFEAVQGNSDRTAMAARRGEPSASASAGRTRPIGQGLSPSRVPARAAGDHHEGGAARGGQRAGRGELRPSGVPVVQRKPNRVGVSNSGSWWADDRNTGVQLLKMKSNSPDDKAVYFWHPVYKITLWRDQINDQYRNEKNTLEFWDPTTDLIVTEISVNPPLYQYGQTVFRYDGQQYHAMDNLTGFRSGDLLYGTNERRKSLIPIAAERAGDDYVTADRYNRQVLSKKRIADPRKLDPQVRDYHDYLAAQGPGTAALVTQGWKRGEDPGGLEPRLLRSCTAMIHYKTSTGYTIHFELADTDLATRQYYTETELRYIIENRYSLHMENIVFYRDGKRVDTKDVLKEYAPLVDEVLKTSGRCSTKNSRCRGRRRKRT